MLTSNMRKEHVSAGAVHAVRLLTLEKHPEGCSVVL